MPETVASGIGDDVAQPGIPLGVAINRRATSFRPIVEIEGDVQTVLRQQRAEAIRPFDQRNTRRKRLFDTEFPGFVGAREAIQVKMPNRRPPAFIYLDEGEGRARNFFISGPPSADESTSERGFAGAEIAI